MLRTFVVLLLVVNLAFYAWTQGWLDHVVGVHARGDHEPERLARQVNPDLVKIIAPQSVAAAASAAVRARVCLEAGPFVAGEVTAAEVTLTPLLPAGSWVNLKVEKPAVWAVYMGRYVDREVKKKKADELAQLNIPFEEVSGAPEFEPGLSLGRFEQRAAADAALVELTQRGVRSASVVELNKPTTAYVLRIDNADESLAARVAALKAGTLSRGFGACAKP